MTAAPEAPQPSSARPVSARKTRGWSPARPTGPTTSPCPACCTWRSCAARTRTPRSRVDVSAARQRPGVIAAFSGADFADEQGSLPCAWPVTEDIVIPNHPPMAVDEVRYVGEAVAVVVARDRYEAADALEAIEVDYEPLPPVLDIRTALDEGSPKVHEAGNKSFVWTFGNGDIEAAFRDAPVVLERTYRQQRLIPCAMEPRAVVAWCEGDEFTLWSATQIPHVLRVMLALVTGIGEHEHPGHRARRRRRLRLEAAGHRRGSAGDAGHPQAGQAGQVDRVPQRGQHDRAPRPGPVAADQDRRRRRRADPRPGRRPAGRHGRLPDAGHAGHPAARRVHVQRDLQDGRVRVQVHRRLHHQDADRRLPRRRAARGHVRDRADHGRARGRAGHGPAGAAGAELDQARGVPVHHHRRPDLRLRELRGGHGQGQGAVRLRRAPRQEQAERNARGDSVRLGIGISTFTEMCGLAPSRVLGSLSYGAGGWESASIRMLPTGKVEVVTGSSAHGQGHETAWSQIVADQLGVPFEDIRVLHGDTQISPKGMDTYGSRSLAVGRHGRGLGLRQGRREGQGHRRGHARGLARRPGVDGRAGSRSAATRTRASRSGRSRWPRSPRTTCRTASSRRWTPTPPTTRTTSRSRTAPTCARPRWTPRPAWSRSARTWRSTTSARWSTR